jgi:NAD(P)-dependent dehydrogenase (short-subunit alcohol dehydrogenase family)
VTVGSRAVDVDGTTAVVTGGASGIGRATALELARRGADVVVADIHEERLAEMAARIEALGRRALAVRCDGTSDDDVEALAAAACRAFGAVDVVMNNAGIAVLGPPHRVDISEWERILQVNVLGLVRGVRAFVPAMVERGHGYVVNTASIAGVWAYSWDSAPYITSKFAAYGFSEALARSLRPLGVGVSVLCPGLVHTNLGETARFSGVPDEYAGAWSYFPPEMLESAVEPETVGTLVCDAIEAERFAIFTNADDAARYTSWRVDIDHSLAEAIAAAPVPPRIV